MDSPATVAIIIVSVLALAAVGFAAFRPWHDFKISVSNLEVSFTGQFPPENRAAAIQFFASDLALPGPYRVLGRWRPGRILQLRFRGALPVFHHQRVRNFLR